MKPAAPLRLSLSLWLAAATTSSCLGPGAGHPAGSLATEGLYRHVVAGDPEHPGPPLVVPGASWLEADLEGFLPGRTKLYYDLRGRGRSAPLSGRAALSIQSDVEDLEELRRSNGSEQIDLMRWAYAGGVAERYALEHPGRVNRLLLISPLPPRYDPYWPEFQENYVERVDREAFAALDHWRESGRKSEDPEGYARAYTRITLATFCHDPEDAVLARSHPFGTKAPDPERTSRLNEAIFRRMGPWILDPARLAALKTPVLIVHGAEDLLPLAASEEYVQRLPRAELVVMASCGRLPWVEERESFRELAGRFFETPTR